MYDPIIPGFDPADLFPLFEPTGLLSEFEAANGPRFLEAIPTPLRDLIRREVRRLRIRRRLSMLRALLRRLLLGMARTPFRLPVPAPVVLDSQCQRIAVAPTRGSPRARCVGWAPT